MAERMDYEEFGSYLSQLEAVIRDDGYTPDGIIAVNRGGNFVGADLAHRFGVPMGVIAASHYAGTEWLGEVQIGDALLTPISGGKLLLVDDIVDTGETLEQVQQYLKTEYVTELGLDEPASELRTAVLHRKPQTSFEPDYVVETVENVRYPWEVNEDW